MGLIPDQSCLTWQKGTMEEERRASPDQTPKSAARKQARGSSKHLDDKVTAKVSGGSKGPKGTNHGGGGKPTSSIGFREEQLGAALHFAPH